MALQHGFVHWLCRRVRVALCLGALLAVAVCGGSLGGCGSDHDCESDSDCPEGQTCELCSGSIGTSDILVGVCSGAINADGECDA